MVRPVLFISPNFPPNFASFIVSLRRAGTPVLGLGDAPFHELSPALKENLTEYYHVSSMEEYDQVYRAMAHFTHLHGRIGWVQSHNEHWLLLEARIREDFNIRNGYRVSEITAFKKKSEMKKTFLSLGLHPARGQVMESFEEVREFVRGHKGQANGIPEKDIVGYPIVAKPDCGVGAEDTHKLHSDEDVRAFFQRPHPQPMIFEEYVEGQLFTFDGLTTSDGEPLWYGTFSYGRNVMDDVHECGNVVGHIKRDIPNDVLEAGFALLKAYKVRGHFFHFEFFRTPRGDLVPLEVNLRLPGGSIIDMYDYAFDIDLYQLWADAVSERTDEIQRFRTWFAGQNRAKYFVTFFARRDHLRYQNSLEAVRARCVSHPPSGHQIQILSEISLEPLFRKAMGDYAITFRSESEDAVLSLVEFLRQPAP